MKSLRKDYCEVCGGRAYGGVHHVISKGSGGPDHVYNGIQLCQSCHIFEAHGGHLSKRFLFAIIAKREGVERKEVEETVWGLKV